MRCRATGGSRHGARRDGRGQRDVRHLGALARRKSVRGLEDTRTGNPRAQRGKIVDRELGRTVLNPGVRACRRVWTCPECCWSFVTRNMDHLYGRRTVDDYFTGRRQKYAERNRLSLSALIAVALEEFLDRARTQSK
jgi:hypothetical protein